MFPHELTYSHCFPIFSLFLCFQCHCSHNFYMFTLFSVFIGLHCSCVFGATVFSTIVYSHMFAHVLKLLMCPHYCYSHVFPLCSPILTHYSCVLSLFLNVLTCSHYHPVFSILTCSHCSYCSHIFSLFSYVFTYFHSS